MKKVLLFMVALVASLTLVGCKGKDTANTSEEVTISVQVETDWMPYYETVKEAVVAKYPNATINFIEVTSFDHLDTIDKTDITNKDVADVFAISADRLFGLANNEVLAPLDAKTMAENIGGFDNFDAGLGGNFKIDGSYLAFPLNIETLINFANTENAKNTGIDLTKTIEFTELDKESMLVPIFNAWFGVAIANAGNIEMLGKDTNGELYSDLTKDFENLTADQKTVINAIFEYWQKHYEAQTALWDKEATWGYMDSEFTTGGNNVIRLEGPWSTGGLSEKAGNGEDLAILPINQVTVNGLPLAHWKGGWGMAVNARIEEDANKMEVAQAFIEEIVNPDNAVELFKATGKILENVDAEVYENSNLSETDKKVINAVIESYEDAPARPLFMEWGSVWDTWQNALLSWNSVKPTTVEDAYAEIQAAFKAMMSNY